jgi:glycine dehydrogenase
LAMLTTDNWDFPYTREQAAFPLDYISENKFWPSVRRVDDAYGDRNLVCSCAPIEAYM